MLLLVGLCQTAAGAEPPRYVGRLQEGTRIEGQQLTDWHERPSQPRLDGKPLFEPGRSLRWLVTRPEPGSGTVAAFVEMLGGDRLPGEVVGFAAAGPEPDDALPAHLLVASPLELADPRGASPGPLRVLLRAVRRIVWQRRMTDRYAPGTLLLRDGAELGFRSARFGAQQVDLLLDDGLRSVPFSRIAELHMPQRDPWQAYLDEVAVLCPDLAGTVLQLSTRDGLIATASRERFDVAPSGGPVEPDRWIHGVQPAWSPDLLWVRCETVWLRRVFSPWEVPLDRVAWAAAPRPGNGATQRPHQVNRNVAGGPLVCGGQLYGWGLGVHAPSLLRLELPGIASGVRVEMGLDRLVGEGGCVRARILPDGLAQGPLFESPLLVGSQATHDSGMVKLPAAPAGRSRALLLEVQAAHEDRPTGADPLDIRDCLNWLEPLLELDRDRLPEQLAARRGLQVPAWHGWEVIGRAETVRVNNVLEETAGGSRFRTGAVAADEPLVLRRRVRVTPRERWLVASVTRAENGPQPPPLRLLVNDVPVLRYELPVAGRHQRPPAPLRVPLDSLLGRDVQIELVHDPVGSGPAAPVVWRGLRLSDHLPALRSVLDETPPPLAVGEPAAGQATLVAADADAGARVWQLAAPAVYRLAWDRPIEIRAEPAAGQFRHLRFAVRKQGQGRIGVQLEVTRPDPKKPQPGYDAGTGGPVFPGAQRAWLTNLPDDWIVLTRDLYADFGQIELQALLVHVPDGQSAQLARVYLARAADEFQLADTTPEQVALRRQLRAIADFRQRLLVCQSREQRVSEHALDGQELSQIAVARPSACQGLGNGHRLIASQEPPVVREFDAGGQQVWQRADLPGAPASVERLANGRTLVACPDPQRILELGPDGDVAWQATVDGGPGDAQRLPDGRTLVALSKTDRVVEIDAGGAVVWQLDGVPGPQSAQRLPSGHTLVAIRGERKVVEFNPQRQRVWSREFPDELRDAQRLPNGFTLVVHAAGVTLLDRDDQVAWELKGEGFVRARGY